NVPPPATVAPPPSAKAPPPFEAAPLPPFEAAPPPPAAMPPKLDDGMTVSALQTILSGTLSSQPLSDEPPTFTAEQFDPEKFVPELAPEAQVELPGAPPKKDDFLAQARRAAQAAAQAEAERTGKTNKRQPFAAPSANDRLSVKKLNVGRLIII